MFSSPEQWTAQTTEIEPSAGGIRRRRFLQSAGAAIASIGMLARGSEPASNKSRSINAQLLSIPPNIPGIGKRTHLLPSNAVHGLIFVAQAHWSNKVDRKTAQGIELCQRQIYDALRFLVCEQCIDKVYAEGIMARGEPPYNPAYSDFSISNSVEFEGIDDIAKIGAIFRLKEEGLLAITGAERTRTFDRSGRLLIEQPNSLETEKATYDDRDDVLLSIIHEAKDDIACTVLGLNHLLENSVRRWNKNHPEATFSILTLIPEILATNQKLKLPLVTLPEDRPMPEAITQRTSAPPVSQSPVPPPPECD